MGKDLIYTSVVSLTDIGLVRSNNEDSMLISDPQTSQYLGENLQLSYPTAENRLLMVVSDGMGGAEGGEIASRLTITVMQKELPRIPRRLSPQSRLSAAIEEANAVVRQERKADKKLFSMGATVTAALIERNTAYIAEVGDSRAYIMREGRLKQITTDQTMLQVMLDAGAITPQAAATSRNRNILLQAVGSQEYLQIAVNTIELRRSDLLLLCSDGLSGKLTTEEIATIIKRNESLNAAATELVEAAKEKGGEDNITVILARFSGDGLRPHTQETLTRSIHVLSSFEPGQDPKPKPKLMTRTATIDDLRKAEVIDYYAHTPDQQRNLEALNEFGDYLLCRRGDILSVSCDPLPDTLYCLISGRYRFEVETTDGRKHTLALLISPTDHRSDEEIQMGVDLVRVKRQFFIGTVACLGDTIRSATLWCEDEENAIVQIPQNIYLSMGEIIGDRFLTAIRYC